MVQTMSMFFNAPDEGISIYILICPKSLRMHTYGYRKHSYALLISIDEYGGEEGEDEEASEEASEESNEEASEDAEEAEDEEERERRRRGGESTETDEDEDEDGDTQIRHGYRRKRPPPQAGTYQTPT
jgi:hypothetical protein